MEIIAREKFIERLRKEWQALPTAYHRLDPAAQRAYLDQQGYATFGSLLGHIIAWWEDGALKIAAMRADPALPLDPVDVNAFNARAVERFRQYSEAEIVQKFEAQRRIMEALVNELSDAEITQENINTRLFYEVIGHWEEHKME